MLSGAHTFQSTSQCAPPVLGTDAPRAADRGRAGLASRLTTLRARVWSGPLDFHSQRSASSPVPPTRAAFPLRRGGWLRAPAGRLTPSTGGQASISRGRGQGHLSQSRVLENLVGKGCSPSRVSGRHAQPSSCDCRRFSRRQSVSASQYAVRDHLSDLSKVLVQPVFASSLHLCPGSRPASIRRGET